jgi:hypothetical protein
VPARKVLYNLVVIAPPLSLQDARMAEILQAIVIHLMRLYVDIFCGILLKQAQCLAT